MRGIDWFPREDERDWVRIYDRYIVQMTVNNPDRNFNTNPWTSAEHTNFYNHIVRNNDYAVWRERRDRELEGERVFWKGVKPLDLNELEEVQTDRPRLQAFRLNYDTLDEVRMRFNKTVILIKGHPFYVPDQRTINNSFYLLVEDVKQKKSYISLGDVPDLRPAPPCYVRLNEVNGYLRRSPARVNQQGMTTNSVVIRRVGAPDHLSFNQGMLVAALTTRGSTLKWDKSYRKLVDDRIVPSLRLSDTLALYTKSNADEVFVEYKGRRLGELKDHSIKVFDEDDVIQPWLQMDAKKVDLEVIQ